MAVRVNLVGARSKWAGRGLVRRLVGTCLEVRRPGHVEIDLVHF